MARIEYSHVKSFFPLDVDELLLCPEGSSSVISQRAFQQSFLTELLQSGKTEELRVLRRNYDINTAAYTNVALDDTARSMYVQRCLKNAYRGENAIGRMLNCWGVRYYLLCTRLVV